MENKATLKGNQIKLLKEFIEKRFGENAVYELCRHMEPESAEKICQKFVDVSRFPEELYVMLLDKMEEIHGKGNWRLCRDAGRYLANESIPKFYSVFIVKADPHFIIKRATSFWRSVHNSGEIRFESSGNNQARGYLKGFDYLSDSYIAVLLGFFEGIGQLLKKDITKLTAEKHYENARECCEFIIEWK